MTLPGSLRLLQDLVPALCSDANSSSDILTLHLMDEALSSILTAIRERLNQVAPINRFPPEVLSAIFDLVRYGTSTSEDTAHEIQLQEPDYRSLIASSQVCRYWRDVALASPSLWVDIVAYSTSARTFAQRAGSLPLTFFAQVESGKLTKTQKRVLWQFRPRIRALSVTVGYREHLRVFSKLLRELAPVIQNLSIVVHRDRWRREYDPTAILFYSAAPSLRSLSVSSPYTFLPMDPYPALAHLNLHGFRRGQFDIRLIVSLFQNTPILRTFHLHLHPQACAIPVLSLQPTPPIYLRTMSYFCITDLSIGHFNPQVPQASRYHGIDTILSTFTFPQRAFVAIQEDHYPPALRAPDSLAPSALTLDDNGTTLAAHRASNSDPRCTHLLGHSPRFTPCHILRSSAPSPLPLCYCHCHTLHGAHCTRAPSGVSLDDATRAALLTVRTLRIQGSYDWYHHARLGAAELSMLAACMPTLTKLVLRDFKREMLPHLVHLLTQSNPTLCPHLATVIYITLDSAGRENLPGEFALTSDALFSATAQRETVLGRPLARLVFCSPRNVVDRVMRDAHGAERVEVLRQDVWEAEFESVEQDAREHRYAVKKAVDPDRQKERTMTYELLWRDPNARARFKFNGWGSRTGSKWP